MFTTSTLLALLPLLSSLSSVSAAPTSGQTPNRLAAGRQLQARAFAEARTLEGLQDLEARGLGTLLTGILGDGDEGAPVAIAAADATTQFLRPALFSQAVYCSSASLLNWKCGKPCESLGNDIKVLEAGGDNGATPGFMVAIDPKDDAVVVVHQGTDAKSIMSVLNDAQFLLQPINSTLFPGASPEVEVHEGFAEAQQRTAALILGAVQGALKDKKASKVRVFGHSLGAAIAMMDALMFKMVLDPKVDVQTTVFGLPRGGNQAYADLLDEQLGKTFIHVTNQNDPVPEVPPRFIGYAHASNEVHIREADDVTGVVSAIEACPGQDNLKCSTGNNLLSASVQDHKGPYFREDIVMSHGGCPL